MSATTRKCANPDCGEWYDARAPSCYVCNSEVRETSVAATRASATRELNANLSQHAGRARAEQRIRTPQGSKGGAGPTRLYNVPGARDLAAQLKRNLQEAGFGER